MEPTETATQPAAQPSPSEASERAEALAPYLSLLDAARSADADASDIPETILVEGQTLMLEPWERTVLRKYASGVDAAGRLWPTLVLEGLAFGATALRCSHEHDVAGAKADQEEAVERTWILEAAAGVAILEDLQASVEQLIRAGCGAEAKQLSLFRNRVNESVTRMRQIVGGRGFERAEDRAEGMLTDPAKLGVDSAAASSVADEERREAPVQFKKERARSRRAEEKPATDGRGLMVAVLVGVLLAAAGITYLLAQPRDAALPTLTSSEFGELSVVLRVDPTPPYVDVSVDAPAWNSMAASARLNLIRDIGRVAQRSGYVGAQVRSDDGIAVGNWSKSQGAQVTSETLRTD